MIAFLLLLATDAMPIGPAVSDAIDANDCTKRLGKDEIIVCANRKHVSPYRLPDRDRPFDPFGDTRSVMNERVGWAAEGDVGALACSPVGPTSGWVGCKVKSWKESRDQTQWKKNIPKRRW